MRYVWTLLRARTKGLRVGRDGVKDVLGLVPSLYGVLKDLAACIYVAECSFGDGSFRGMGGPDSAYVDASTRFLHTEREILDCDIICCPCFFHLVHSKIQPQIRR